MEEYLKQKYPERNFDRDKLFVGNEMKFNDEDDDLKALINSFGEIDIQ
jgi:FKBP-type peptidyl-prolyl cis-trans isomerase 2